ncbi:MAG: histidine phosphatase family protein [Pseudomonadota bacterium]
MRRFSAKRRVCFGLLTLASLPPLVLGADSQAKLWQMLQGEGLVVLMRHAATVPGVGDPPGFELTQCATQRNLSTAGQSDAKRIGERFRANGVRVESVLSSRWCRCLDTARLAFGRAQAAPMLDSMFRDEQEGRQRKLLQVRSFLVSRSSGGLIVMVTHDVNIQALLGLYLRQGEIAVAAIGADGSLRSLGTAFLPA